MELRIARPGLLTTVQDCGRWGFQARGVPVSGAMDVYSLRLANAIVGNPEGAAALEATLLGPQIEFSGEATFAVSGALFELVLDGGTVPMHSAIAARDGSCLQFGARTSGARAYLAVSGGIDVPIVLGSRSTHIVSGMGGYEGRALRAGDRLKVGRERAAGGPASWTLKPDAFLPVPTAGARVRVLPGDRGDLLLGNRYRISTRSDRMGYRLEGPALAGHVRAEMISTPVPAGAIQLPPGGGPILLMADRATTGGYEIAATVITADLPIVAQLAPGDWLEFERCSLDEADRASSAREAALAGRAA